MNYLDVKLLKNVVEQTADLKFQSPIDQLMTDISHRLEKHAQENNSPTTT